MSLGFGLGLRPAHYRYILDQRPAVDWFEIVSENYLGIGGRPRTFLDQVRAHYPVVMHGVGLSIASTGPLNRRYLTKLKELADQIQPRFVTDHLCWTSHRGVNSHDLLPVAYTEEVLAHVARRVDEVQTFLGRRLFLENPSAYVAFASSEMTEAEFLAELCRRTGSGILLDVNNLYVNQQNLGMDPADYLDHLKEEWLAYFHLAGHSVTPEIRIDTHDATVPDGVLALYEEVARRFRETATMVEWDGDVPEFPVVFAELEKARAAHARASTGGRAAYSSWTVPRRTPPPNAPRWEVAQDAFWAMATGQKSIEDGDAGLAAFESGLPAKARVGINVYADAYYLRICEAVRDTYPSLKYVLGEGILDQVVRAYLAKHPSREVSIKYAGRALPGYLRDATLPAACRAPNAVLADVAALEWAREDVFDREAGPAPLSASVLAEIREAEWPEVRFEFTPVMELVEAEHAVHTVLAAVAADEPPELPRAARTSYLVYREDDEVRHRELPAQEAAVLRALVDGATFFAACEAAAKTSGSSLEKVVPETVTRLGDWFGLGLVTGLGV